MPAAVQLAPEHHLLLLFLAGGLPPLGRHLIQQVLPPLREAVLPTPLHNLLLLLVAGALLLLGMFPESELQVFGRLI